MLKRVSKEDWIPEGTILIVHNLDSLANVLLTLSNQAWYRDVWRAYSEVQQEFADATNIPYRIQLYLQEEAYRKREVRLFSLDGYHILSRAYGVTCQMSDEEVKSLFPGVQIAISMKRIPIGNTSPEQVKAAIQVFFSEQGSLSKYIYCKVDDSSIAILPTPPAPVLWNSLQINAMLRVSIYTKEWIG